MLRFGDVVEVDLVKARYRVYFPVDDVISFPLPHVAFSVDGATPHLPISKGTQVACLVDGMEGVILGAVFTDKKQPTSGLTESDFAIDFNGGGRIVWDGSAFKISLNDAEIELSAQGVKIAKAGDSLKAIVGELISAISVMTHLSAAPTNPTSVPTIPTSVPVNVSTFAALKLRAEILLN